MVAAKIRMNDLMVITVRSDEVCQALSRTEVLTGSFHKEADRGSLFIHDIHAARECVGRKDLKFVFGMMNSSFTPMSKSSLRDGTSFRKAITFILEIASNHASVSGDRFILQ